MNRVMLLGLLVCISRVALCGVMGVMAETVARRAGSSSLRGLCRLCVVAYALVLVASFAPMDSAQTVVHRCLFNGGRHHQLCAEHGADSLQAGR